MLICLFAWDFPNYQNLGRKPSTPFILRYCAWPLRYVTALDYFVLISFLSFYILLKVKRNLLKFLSANLMATSTHNQLLQRENFIFNLSLAPHIQTITISANSNSEKHTESGSPEFSQVGLPLASWTLANISTITALLFILHLARELGTSTTFLLKYFSGSLLLTR